MKCYIRNVLLINPSSTNGNIDYNCLEVVVRNYPKHGRALVYVKEDDSCIKSLIGKVERIYTINNCLFGDISFTKDWKFVVSNLVYKPFPLATISGIFDTPDFTHLDEIEFIDNESDACSDAIDLSKICGEQEYAYWIFNRPRYDSVQEATQPEIGTLFKKKYDDVNSGFIGTVESTNSEGKEPVITFDSEGRDIGNGILRYGHYKNGALMGYVVVKVTEFGGDDRRQEPLYILEKLTEHQRKNNKVITRSIEMYVDDTEMKNLSEDERQKRLKDLRDLSRKS
ncbi:hypothetical protein UJ48_20555 [Salmonella enterica]|nr:hypothetical protein [Salmonella enterica]EDC3113649.1 hypothetical protein [Salmonella enterica]